MDNPQDPAEEAALAADIDRNVAEIVGEAHVQAGTLKPEEREYLKEHALKKPMGVLHIWALGVGVVITGEYFGWNQGLRRAARSACCSRRSSCAPCT